MYSVHAYGRMIADRVRTDAYLEALRRTVTPDSVVVDIGTGTGIFALYAAKLGARQVYAVEPSDVIQVARVLAQANGVASTIDFVQALSTDVKLPELADVIVSDLRGAVPIIGGHFRATTDARTRLLKPGGVLIPAVDELWLAVVQVERYEEINEPWESGVADIDLRAGKPFVVNVPLRSPSVRLLSAPNLWATLEYATLTEDRVQGSADCPVTVAGTGHGLVLWFRTTLLPGVGFETHPDGPPVVYGQLFLPWETPVALEPGDGVAVQIRADSGGGDYTWSWKSRVSASDGAHRASFEQSTFFGAPVPPERLGPRREDHVVNLGIDGHIDAALLAAFVAGSSVGRAADEIAAKFRLRFPTRATALKRAADIAQKYGAAVDLRRNDREVSFLDDVEPGAW